MLAGSPKTEKVREKATRASDLGPGQDQATTMIVTRAIWDGLMKDAVKKRAGVFYAFGEIIYFDAFQDRTAEEPRHTRYNFRLSVDDAGAWGFSLAESGNQST